MAHLPLPRLPKGRRSPHRKTASHALRVETLESRELLASDLVISEFVANSAARITDLDGDTSDWIELHNPSDTSVDLAGWSLTDDANDLAKWQFPNVRIDPYSYLVVFASGKDRAADAFRISRDYNATPDGTFLVDLADGLYDVRIGMGDSARVRDDVIVSLQGEAVETVSTAAGDYFSGSYRAEVSADTGGQLALRIEDTGGETGRGVINSLVITPVAGGDQLRFDFGTDSSPVEMGFVPVTTAETYQPATRFGWQAGIVVSQKDRGTDRDELHTNFKLSSNGEFLALVQPDGQTIAYQFTPEYPAQRLGVSLGLEQEVVASTPIAVGDQARWIVPTPENGGGTLGRSWTEVDFDDGSWSEGPTGIGFADGTPLEDLVATNIGSDMNGVNGSAYLRFPFTVNNPGTVFSLLLKMKYDDGYVAYLNGTEIASANKPGALGPDSTAENPRLDTNAETFEDVDISQYTGLLREGTNILAIHGLNRRASGDNVFLVVPQVDMRQSRAIENMTPRYFATPTPGAPNGNVSFGGLAARPAVDAPGGIFDGPFEITIDAATPGATLIVTTDGSRPSLDNGTQFVAADSQTAPIGTLPISSTTVVRAISVKDDFLASQSENRTYIFPEDVPSQTFQATIDAGFPDSWSQSETFPIQPDYGLDPKFVGPDDLFDGRFADQIVDALRAVPSISMVTDFDNLFGPDGILDTGNANLSGLAGERPTSIELLNPDGSPGFQIDAGVRIQGDASRNYSSSKKRSFRFAFRKQYGAGSLVYPLFGENATDRFNTIRLRANYNDGPVHTPRSTQNIRDEWMRRTLLAMENPNANGTFMHLYINGFYWGLYNVVERPDGAFSETYFGGDKDEWDTISASRPKNGNSTAWGDLNRESLLVGTAPDQAASNAAYQRLLGNNPDGTNNPDYETLLDVDNYIDYLIANFYGGNSDWPGRNYYMGRLRGPDSTGFKFFSWDAEKVLGHEEGSFLQMNNTGANGDVARFYGQLRTNDEFRLRFADRVQKQFFNGGPLYVDPENPAWDPANPERNVPAARYQELADFVELPLVAEYARWGDTGRRGADTLPDGTSLLVTPDTWAAFRDRLFQEFFPQRSGIVLNQIRAASLFPSIDAPAFNQHGGEIEPGF
ncbi:MAG: CotH kinase family protein, partial [Pirellulales bacterium]